MTALRNPRSKTKADIIVHLMASPRLKSDIVSEYSKQSSKGIYRHLIDLESEKIIKEIKQKGLKTLLVLNKRDLTSASNAFKHLLDVNQYLRLSFDKAFAECASSAYGDFPVYNSRLEIDTTSGIVARTLDALIKAERSEIDDQFTAKVSSAIKKIRGVMTVKDKLIYIALTDLLTKSAWTPDETSQISLVMPFLFSMDQQERQNGYLNDQELAEWIWNVVIPRLISMAADRRKNFLDDVRDSREMKLMSARMALYESSLLPLNDIDIMSRDILNRLDRRFMSPDRKTRFGEEITDVSQLPEVYRREAEGKI
jgi:hypothetical protein